MQFTRPKLFLVSAIAAAIAVVGLAQPQARHSADQPQSEDQPQVESSGRGPLSVPIGFVPLGGSLVARARDVSAVLSKGTVMLAANGVAIGLEMSGSNPEAVAEGEEPLPVYVNYLLGDDQSAWHTGLPLYGRARYREMYPGIDMVYGSSKRNLKSEFVVAPGADPSAIRMRYSGATDLAIADDGSLVLTTETGELRESAPEVFQQVEGRRVEVVSRFVLRGDEVGFEIGDYDPGLTLWIDPDISYSGYFGGIRSETATAVATGPAGEIVLAGWTDSPDLPGRWLYYFGGGVDAFVAKFPDRGNSPTWVTYFGGTAEDKALGVAVDSKGNVWFGGTTTSTNLPRATPLQISRRGTRDAFVSSINSSGIALLFSTYWGGSQQETATAVKVDASDNVWVAGETNSANFPTVSPYQRFLAGMKDAFLLKLNSANIVVASTFLGGAFDDRATSLAVGSWSVAVGGCTASTNFPTAAAAQGTIGGGQDGFVTSFNSALTGLNFSTYIGGSGGAGSALECVNAVAVDTPGNTYAAGNTPSTNFPVTVPFQAAHGGGGQDGFVAKFGGYGTRVYSSFLGGRGIDHATAVAIDATHRPWVVGYTSSNNFPTLNAIQATSAGGYDAFATRIESSGAIVNFSTYIGGMGSDSALAAAFAPISGHLVVTGSTSSVNFPTRNALFGVFRGSTDSFLLQLTP